MELGIENQVAFVTGAAKGIGLACARTLAREGCRVVVADIDGAAAECAAQAIVQAGGAALARTLDVSRPDSVKQVVADVLANWGGISILVNNAGFSRDSAIAQMSDAQWADVLTVNLSGAFHCIREIAPLMVERAYGRIVNMASRAHFGDINKANYSASKAGVIGMTRALAVTSRTRSAQLPDVPTLREAGFPDYEVSVWFCVAASADTPKDRISILNAALNKVLADPAVRERIASLGAQPLGGPPQDLARQILAEEKNIQAVTQVVTFEN